MTVNGMNKEQYIKWYKETYNRNEAQALNSWNFWTEKKEEKSFEEKFEETRNAYLY